MDRNEAIEWIIGLDKFIHSERGSGPYEIDPYLRDALIALGATGAEVDAALAR